MSIILPGIQTNNFDLGAHTKGCGHFLKNLRDPAQNLGVVGYWAPVSLYPCLPCQSLRGWGLHPKLRCIFPNEVKMVLFDIFINDNLSCGINRKCLRSNIRVSNGLDPVQDQSSVNPDLGLNCLQMLSADEKSLLAR